MRPSVEYQRLVRAIGIIRAAQKGEKTIHRFGPHQFRVKGNVQPWYDVELTAEQRCYCDDARFAPRYERMCKHEIACRLANMEPGMLSHMVDLIAKEEQRKLQAA